MSQPTGSKEHWKPWEFSGISRQELALAEALQMEYDALSRLRQSSTTRDDSKSKHINSLQLISFEDPLLEYSQLRNDCNTFKGTHGLSGSDPGLSYSKGPSLSSRGIACSSTTSVPRPPNPQCQEDSEYHSLWKDVTTATTATTTNSTISGCIQQPIRTGLFTTEGSSCHRGDYSIIDYAPPIPPRVPLGPSRNAMLTDHWSKGQPGESIEKLTIPNDINIFSPNSDDSNGKIVEPPSFYSNQRISDEEFELIDYDDLNDAITKLNLMSTYGENTKLIRVGSIGPNSICKRKDKKEETSGKPVSRSKTLPPQVPPRTYMSKYGNQNNAVYQDKNQMVSIDPSTLQQNYESWNYELLEVSEERNEEVAAFCHMLDVLRSSYTCDGAENMGLIWSPVVIRNDQHGDGISVKVTVSASSLSEPLTFTCDGGSTVDLVIYQTLCYIYDNLRGINVDNFVLKICGLEEFLQNKHTIGSHKYVQFCRKFDVDIKLYLIELKAVRKDLMRTVSDDQSQSTLNHFIHLQERPLKQTVTRQALTLLFDTYQNEVDNFLLAEVDHSQKAERVVQSVMAICNALALVETQEITNALNQLPPCPSRLHPRIQKDPCLLTVRENRAKIGEALTAAILDLVELYCNSFNADFHTVVPCRRDAQTQSASLVDSPLCFTIYAAHRIPISWATSYEDFYLSCGLSHGGKELCGQLQTKKAHVYKYLFHLLIWDQNICFPININQLPQETLLTLTLYAFPVPPPGTSSEGNKQRRTAETMGWVTMPLFNFRHVLSCGRKLLGLWPSCQRTILTTLTACNFIQPDSVILQIDFPSSAFDVKFITPPPAEFSPKYDFNSLDDTSRKRLKEVMQKKSLFWLTEVDKKLLWEKRYYCHTECSCLPLVLASAPSWEWACLPDIYTLLKQWNCLSHLDALGLLHATFPDQELRRTAVHWMETMSTSELVDFLPQLVQALKFECYLDSPLVRFLLRRAICDVKIAHYFYWLLKDALNDSHFSARYQHLLGALLCCVGKGMREEFDKQTKLTHILAKIAQKVRDVAPSSRQTVLRENMEEVQQFFNVQDHCRLPLNPSLLANGVNPRACSFFNSNAVPLKISFINADPLGENINVIVKTGDDLRQDMLTLQMIRIMNKIWIQEGLDMRMIFFKCTSTGWGRGMVEMIPNAETLRKIQVEHGVTGSFKDHPLAEWLQKHNPNEDEYEKAVENFIYSCAGCCVATYVLGICDRHNDNIMLKTSGHMFHIDFGKFLGHAQMLGNFKRDRAPFVFTSDMAYVINGGDKPSSRFHDFVDLCCQAYNLIRKHTDLFLNLLGLMLSCGIPELSDVQDLRYVYDALRPQETDTHATTYFTRLIESSLGSVATKLNFFLHNLAQMKFSGIDDHPTLSYAPKTYTIKTDGKIKEVFVCRHQKIFNPNKGYAYVVKVEREGQHDTAFILRTFEEFNELHNKLRLLFPSSKLPSFPSRFVLGRGEAMAERRKEELDSYIWHLIHSPPEVAECDLVYTFFHPLPKDDKSLAGNTVPKPTDVPPTPPMGKVGGEVKLSISYKNDKLFIMVMHIRGLVLQDGTDPDPYVKIYLLPDPQKTSKRKTKVARKTCNPTYNEMLVYDGIPKGDVQQRVIHLRVLSEEAFRENIMLGEVYINLKDFNLNQKIVGWYHLGSTTPQGTLF
ncbi:phosphatidylinositol 4-phosphate 3-kinase C2 domain-containing subunit beta [Chiloscyllium plagiosum]|uniref:phosphatidylinositol 4-phosphate 3-kinase C2 domain-containing subunit beta n=1 Tax=Chiloscyllium plagiosum TaxID=36176 RepID=UPI001CB82BED|nr:phosphatidylinositol 4-phosphate 3-kinase C2 domain-containing subunit beta [Chiloscyllium plagiosum]XP_043572379.1 phosphatidylinositol 4-phosphate 3-kinase C2 domain-containing subunit beta [Chiloscyllium plagiosum]XP_043572380.1 phosphatidylinositol 4-phosphate 3-kinase C2 domain-containing subunit beta [Chiloscyllium plagiosum]XP_043572381.1 phosphatidylinositol 4-phosphate 3-kinase C2 domain-containing subunit beta [Chiloscyllium plagiosum]XP_043572382.1 phosphatidylinositol 4-phosphate